MPDDARDAADDWVELTIAEMNEAVALSREIGEAFKGLLGV